MSKIDLAFDQIQERSIPDASKVVSNSQLVQSSHSIIIGFSKLHDKLFIFGQFQAQFLIEYSPA
jgi:hypothetical protein